MFSEYLSVHCFILSGNSALEHLCHRELSFSLQSILFIFLALAAATGGHRGQDDQLTEQQNTTASLRQHSSAFPPYPYYHIYSIPIPFPLSQIYESTQTHTHTNK